MTTAVHALTHDTFDEMIATSDVPVVVEFWAEWCPPCKLIAPVLESIAVAQAHKLRIFKVNVDEHSELAVRYDVVSIPTLLVFRDGGLIRRMVGARSHSQLVEEIEESVR
jgi:thioredoxin 1